MFPYIHIFGFHIPTFGLLLWCAAVAAALIMERNFRRFGLDADAVGMVALAVVAGIIGAKLWHILDTPSDVREMGWAVLWDQAGFAWFGGLTFGLAALIIQGRRAGIGSLRILDLASAAAAVGYGIGRIGCFLAGDGCYGIATTLPWGMSFPHGIDPIYQRVHPTPLYELIGGLIIGWWLWRRGAKPHRTGWLLGQYLILTGLARFLVEFLRRNPRVLWGLSNAQLASLGSIAAGVVLLIWLYVYKPVPPEKDAKAKPADNPAEKAA